MGELIPAARVGLPVLGICNGFQILCEAHLLPGALTRNAGLRFITRDLRLRVENARTAWTRAYDGGQQIVVPLKSGEGAYAADAGTLADLEASGQVVVRYASGNPNGSAAGIAGVCNAAGNVVGLMPHPEHAVDGLTGPSADGLGFFASVVAGVRRDRAEEGRYGGAGGGAPDTPQPFAELGLTEEEYARIVATLGRRPTECRAGPVLGYVERALLVQVLQGAPEAVRGQGAPVRRAARGHRRQRRGGRYRPGLRGHLQDRIT